MADDPKTMFVSKLRPGTAPRSSEPHGPTLPSQHQDRREAYEAFDAKEKAYAHGMDIRCSRNGSLSYAVMYNYIHTIAYDRRTWTRIFLTVSGLAIEIRGHNLRQVVEAIRTRTCHWIQEYSDEEHILPQPIDSTAAFIESISVEVIGGKAPADKFGNE